MLPRFFTVSAAGFLQGRPLPTRLSRLWTFRTSTCDETPWAMNASPRRRTVSPPLGPADHTGHYNNPPGCGFLFSRMSPPHEPSCDFLHECREAECNPAECSAVLSNDDHDDVHQPPALSATVPSGALTCANPGNSAPFEPCKPE